MRTTRCLLCSLNCAVGFAAGPEKGATEVLTEYAADDPVTGGRLCFRGHYLAEMAAHPLRLTEAARRGEAAGPLPMDRAVALLGSRLSEAGTRAGIVVDGNLPTEDVVAALRLARDAVKTDLAGVYLPDSDRAMIQGIRPGTAKLGLEDVGGCDFLLCVGDVFATHPVISRHILDARSARKALLFGMDCTANRVGGFAVGFVRVRPGGEAAALAALCKMTGREIPPGTRWGNGLSPAELAERAGVSASDLEPVAESLVKAKQGGVLLSAVPGRMSNVRAVASVASVLCDMTGLRLMPMFRYGNAPGAARASMGFSGRRAEEVFRAALEMKVDVLLCMGVDVLRLLSEDEARQLRSRVSVLATASAFRNRSTEQADVVLPLATWFEGGGTVLDATGNEGAVMALMAPAGGAVSVGELCARLAREAGVPLGAGAGPDLPEAFEGAAVEVAEADEAPVQGLQLVARADSVDFDMGSMSRALAWPRHLEPAPDLLINPAEARARGLAPRSSVVIRANGNEARARLVTSSDIPRGMAAVSTAFDATRRLFRRRTDGTAVGEMLWSEADVAPEAEL